MDRDRSISQSNRPALEFLSSKPTTTLLRGVSAVLLTLFCSAALVGCGGHNTHQLVGDSSECGTCHSDEKVIYEGVLVPSSAVDVGTTVEVKTKHNAVYVSIPLFTSGNGSTFVPLIYQRIPAENGIATITLEPGTWVLSVDDGETAESILVDCIPQIVTTTKKITL